MTKNFQVTENIQLSENFCSREFYCKCGQDHEQIISEKLVEKLQSLIRLLGADKAIITSGYRCPAHDKAVGGNGYGMHTKGLAADVIFYKKGTPICTKKVACKAQDLGFTGIANIDSTYTAIHLDVRSGVKWFGDEVITSAYSVTDDFYKYYGFTRHENSDIKTLQNILNNKGAELAADGIAGNKTLMEVRKYIIEKGDCGELTQWVQERLNFLGFDSGKADGIAGNKTMSAIAEFQKKNNLGVGYLGGSDWNILINGK